MTTSTIRAALDTFQQAANRGTAVYLSPELVQELRDALKAEPEGPSLDDVDELCAEFGFHLGGDQGEGLDVLRDMITAAIARWGHPATLPAPEQGEAFQDGVGTVVAVLKRAAVGPWDSQTLAVFGVGSAPQAGEGEA